MIDSEYQPELNDNTSSFPWPPRDGDSAIDALATTWKESVFHPTEFFRRMPREFDFGWVLAYYLIIGVVAGGASLFWHMVLGPPTFLARIFPEMFEGATVRNPVVDFLLSPLWLVFFLFFMGGVYHLCLKMVGGAKTGFGTTLRVLSYSSSPQIMVAIPFVGGLIGGIWGLVAMIIGIREAHETTTGKAIGALLIPMLFFLALGVIFVVGMLLVPGLNSPR